MCLSMRSSRCWIRLYCVNSSLADWTQLTAEKDLCTLKWYTLKHVTGWERGREGEGGSKLTIIDGLVFTDHFLGSEGEKTAVHMFTHWNNIVCSMQVFSSRPNSKYNWFEVRKYMIREAETFKDVCLEGDYFISIFILKWFSEQMHFGVKVKVTRSTLIMLNLKRHSVFL